MEPAFGELQEERKDVACAGTDGRTELWNAGMILPPILFVEEIFDSLKRLLEDTKALRMAAETAKYCSVQVLQLE